MLYKRSIFLLLFCLFSLLGLAQKDRKEIPLKNILGIISKQHQVRFSYIEDEIVVYALTPPEKNWSLEEKINYLKSITKLQFKRISEKYFTIYDDKKVDKPLCGFLLDAETGKGIENAIITIDKADFSAFTDDDLAEAEKLIKLIARRLAQKPSRRFEPTRRGGVLDLRRTLQKNFRNGEEILFLHHKKAKPTRVKLFLICDVSKSMEIYSRFFVQFMYAFKKVYHRIETYIFSTSLQRISDELNESDFQTALRKVSDIVPHWAGGTDIGQSLQSFAENDCQQLDRKSIVLIISDGLDMGEPEIVEESLKAIKKRANKIVWLNPLAGHAGYKPEARTMKAALPLLDVFSSGHNFETLKEVILKLKV